MSQSVATLVKETPSICERWSDGKSVVAHTTAKGYVDTRKLTATLILIYNDLTPSIKRAIYIKRMLLGWQICSHLGHWVLSFSGALHIRRAQYLSPRSRRAASWSESLSEFVVSESSCPRHLMLQVVSRVLSSCNGFYTTYAPRKNWQIACLKEL